jgi:hypothetical protein
MSNDEYVKSEWIIEHNWLCKHCKHENLGRDDKCVNCGKPIDSSHEEIIPEDMSKSNSVKDESLIERFKAGPDWVCFYCKHRNLNKETECEECGSKRSEGEEVKETKVISPPPKKKETIIQQPPSSKETENPFRPIPREDKVKEETVFPQPIKKQLDLSFLRYVFGAMLVLLLCFGLKECYTYFFSWMPTKATVTSTQWSYTVTTHQRVIESGNDWESNMPRYSFNISCHQEIRSYHRCNPYNCNPHQESYSCNCTSREECTPRERCRTECRSNRNRSSSCREICRTVNECSTRRTCETCYRTVYDTCYQRCPDYENRCTFQYPSWRQQNHATNTEQNSINITRPSIANNLPLCGSNPEEYVWRSQQLSLCYLEQREYEINFSIHANGESQILHPTTDSEFLTYRTGQVWDARWNRAGGFELVCQAR